MKLLVISHRFPPVASAESIVSVKTIKALVEFGWEITLITSDPNSWVGPYDEELANFYGSMEIEIIRVGSILNVFNKIKNPGIKRYAYAAFLRIIHMLGILEPEHYWFRPAVEAARKVIENKKIDIVYSRSSCINSNLVGLAIKKEFNLPWIAHFSDPWIDNSIRKFNAIQKGKLIKYEFEVVHSADYLEFTSDETIPLVMKKYDLHQLEKAFCSPHGFDEDVKRLVSPEEISTENTLVLSYSGSFYEKRSPITLFFALQKMSQDDLEKIQIILNGPNLEIYTSILKRLNIQKAVKLIPSKSYLLSLSLASTADVLMVIDAPNDEESVFLPSKLSDYMLLSKPVIGLTPHNGASAKLIRELGGNVVDPLDIEGIKALLCHLLQLWEQNKLAVSDNYYITREKYSVKETNSKLHKKLLELTDH